MKIELFKKYFCIVLHLVLFTEKKIGEKNKKIFKQIPPSTYYQLFDL